MKNEESEHGRMCRGKRLGRGYRDTSSRFVDDTKISGVVDYVVGGRRPQGDINVMVKWPDVAGAV